LPIWRNIKPIAPFNSSRAFVEKREKGRSKKNGEHLCLTDHGRSAVRSFNKVWELKWSLRTSWNGGQMVKPSQRNMLLKRHQVVSRNQIRPALSFSTISFSLSWKSGMAAEILAQAGSMGMPTGSSTNSPTAKRNESTKASTASISVCLS
jgi:hypothetical protein